ncbi:sulfurtransferase-like selenium metabolism protein YedF [Desulfobacterales bacterium HSG2]|nr:sulfurtransferase-like selenium metabolism protein YedF [Desulfobacterales bacterium HSG2]
MKEIDARGLACPAPVLMTKDAVEKEHAAPLKVIVDNKAAKENVSLFLESRKFEVSVQEEGGHFHITGKREGDVFPEASAIETTEAGGRKIMLMVATDRIGHGDDELGLKLMKSFITTLKEMGPELWRLIFVNNGVKLTIDDSDVLPELKALEADDQRILVCGTCLNHFNLLERKQVGETTNMLDIVTSMQLADKVINI